MLYQSYKDKLNKRNKIILRLWKFRFIICAVILAVIACTVLLCLTGSVFAENFVSEIYYGESLQPGAKALFKPVAYEYRAAGEEEWQSASPRLAGEYEVRAYSNDISGAKRYGKIHSYKILPVPVEITIEDDQIDYGAEPTCSAVLRYGDELSVNGFIYEPLEDGNFYISARADSVKILSAEEGKDVTSSYVLNTVKKAVVNIPRPITVRTGSESFVYDGNPHFREEWEITSELKLIEGHLAEVYFPSATEVGKIENRPQIKIMCGDKEVTRYYKVTGDFGELSVEPRPITVKTGSRSFTYDGAPHSEESAQVILGNLVGEHGIDIDYVAVSDAGKYKNNPVSFIIKDEKGNDKTSSYAVTFEAGDLHISPRVLKVTTPSDSWTYDGAEHFNSEYFVSEVLEGHTFSGNVTSCAKITDAGSLLNSVILEIEVFHGGEDVTANYTLDYEYGKLSVVPRKFKVRTGSACWVYDKKPHTCLDFELVESGGDEGLLQGAVAVPLSAGITGITDSTEVGYADNILGFTITHNGRDVTKNYEAYGEWGKLRIKSPVEITLFGKSKYYDGLPLELSKTDCAVTKVPPDVKAEWVSVEIGLKLNTVGELSPEEAVKSCSAALVDESGKDRTAGGENRIDFVCNSAPLKILPRTIEITSVSISKTADGKILSGNVGKNSAWISLGTLLHGHRIEIEVTGALSPGEASAQNTITSVRIVDEKGESVLQFYKINLRHGVLRWI